MPLRTLATLAVLFAATTPALTDTPEPHCPRLSCQEAQRAWRAESLHARLFGLAPPQRPAPACPAPVG